MPPPLGTWSAPSRKRWRRGCGRRISAAARAPATSRTRSPSASPRTRSMPRTRHLTLATLLLTMTRAADSQQPPRPTTLAHRSTVYAPHGMIATSQPLATAAGRFPVTPIITAEWGAEVAKLRKDEGARASYLVEGSRAPRPGEWFRNPDLARTLRLIAEQGIGELYGGELGRRIAERVRALGGYLTVDDFKSHRPEWVEPIAVTFRGYRVWELPPNSQGVAALEMLKILEPFDLKGLGHNSAAYLHLLIETKKLAYADIARYTGDPAAMSVPTGSLLTDAYAASRRALIDPARAADRPAPGKPLTASETIYLTVADSSGNIVSFINSLYDAFGSGVVVPGTGFALQDRGAGFTLEPGLPNTVAPGKRPFHTIIPAFVTRPDGAGGDAPWLSFGVMGGSMQPQGHVQLLLNLIVFGMDLQDAIDAPRFRHLEGRRVALEAPITDAVRSALAALGHEVTSEAAVAFGGAQAILRLPRGYAGGSDPRKDGMAAGY